MAMSVVYTVVDGVMWQEDRGGTITQYVPDTLGSVVAEMDEAGQITHTADYWPYGEVRTETGTKKSPFGFVGVLGYMKDFADALYVRARYLRTNIARWQTADPLWPRQLVYQYAGLSPINFSDPSGLIVEVCIRPLGLRIIPTEVEYAHWFFNTSRCGARGYERQGLVAGWHANALGQRVNCYLLTTDPAIEACICRVAQSTGFGGHEWKPTEGWILPLSDTPGHYDAPTHNCQTFVQVVIRVCMGGRLDWPETGPKPDNTLPVIKCGPADGPKCPPRWSPSSQSEPWPDMRKGGAKVEK